MSTYIVAFVVSDLKNVSIHDGTNTVWLRDVLPQGKYALTIAQVIIMLLEYHTEIMYELPKLDQVAVPNLHFFGYGELGYCYREVRYDNHVFLDITYWNYIVSGKNVIESVAKGSWPNANPNQKT